MTAMFASNPLGARRSAVRRLGSFGLIGVASTVAYIALFAWLRDVAPAGLANAIALLVTAVGNTAANRWLTFGVRGSEGVARHHAAGLMALAVALLITSGSLAVLGAVVPRHGRTAEVAVLVAANAAATSVRLLLLRLAIDPTGSSASSAQAPFATLSQSKGTQG